MVAGSLQRYSRGGTRTRDPGIMRETAGPSGPAVPAFDRPTHSTELQGDAGESVQFRVHGGRVQDRARPGVRGRVSDHSRVAWGHTGGIGMQLETSGGGNLPHRAPPTKNGPGGVGGRAPRLAAGGRQGAEGALDTLAQPCQSMASAIARRKLAKRAQAKHLTMPIAVGLAEQRSELEKSYRNTVYCANSLRQSSSGSLTARYCGNRWCLVCCRIQIARSIHRYIGELDSWSDKMFVTLTIPNVPGHKLREAIDLLLRAVPQISRAIKRTDCLPFRAIRKVECTYNLRRNDYHPHLHLVVEGQAQAEALIRRWLKLFPDARKAAQDSRPCGAGEALELFKYFTKLVTKTSEGHSRPIPVVALDVIFTAMRGRRVYQPVGFTLTGLRDQAEEAQASLARQAVAPSRIGESIDWQWSQLLADWVDFRTGELLTGGLGRLDGLQPLPL